MRITIEKEHNSSFRENVIPSLEKEEVSDLYVHYPKSIRYTEVNFYDTFLYLHAKLGINIHLIGFPLCVLPNRDYRLFSKKYSGEFVPKCKKCEEKNNCFGIPKNYLKQFGKKEIKPFIEDTYSLVVDWKKDKEKVKELWNLEKERQGVVWNNYFKDIKGKILNAGAGIGVFLNFAPKKIIGIDADRDKINNALKKKGLDLRLGDVTKLDFKNNYFSAIYSNFVFEHLSFSEKEEALREMRRVLKPGGKFFAMIAGKDGEKNRSDSKRSNIFTRKKIKKMIQNVGFKKYSLFNAMFAGKYQGFNFDQNFDRKNVKEVALCLIAEK